MKVSHDEKTLLEEENRKLREENEKLKSQSQQLASQVQTLIGQCSKQKTAIDTLKQELEKSLQCYEERRIELKDTVTHMTSKKFKYKPKSNLIAELKKVKGELEDTLKKNEAYCHQWGHI